VGDALGRPLALAVLLSLRLPRADGESLGAPDGEADGEADATDDADDRGEADGDAVAAGDADVDGDEALPLRPLSRLQRKEPCRAGWEVVRVTTLRRSATGQNEVDFLDDTVHPPYR
jgi:hypothetical protein